MTQNRVIQRLLSNAEAKKIFKTEQNAIKMYEYMISAMKEELLENRRLKLKRICVINIVKPAVRMFKHPHTQVLCFTKGIERLKISCSTLLFDTGNHTESNAEDK